MKKRKFRGGQQIDSIFDCVPKLIQVEKYFDVSLDTILEKIDNRERVELEAVHHLTDEQTNEAVSLSLRLRVSGVVKHPGGWHVTLLLYNRPIDGFGYEERFGDIDGIERNRWHRHVWNPKTQEATGKVSAALFGENEMTAFRDFLIRTFKHMRISYPKDDDYATQRMF